MESPDVRYNFFSVGLLPERNFRFILARSTAIARTLGDVHGANQRVQALLGEAILGSFFLVGHSYKQEGLTVSIQAECEGPVKRLIAFASSAGGVRAYPGVADAEWEGDLYAGKGAGLFTVNRCREQKEKVYSSTVAMREGSLARNIQDFMSRSDQVQGFCRIQSDLEGEGPRVSGYLFQALPDAGADDIDAVLDLLNERPPADVIGDLVDESGGRMSPMPARGRESVRVLRTGIFYQECDCSRDKIENMLFLLGREEVDDVLAKEGKVEVFCEFCRKRYNFTEQDVAQLFRAR